MSNDFLTGNPKKTAGCLIKKKKVFRTFAKKPVNNFGDHI